MHKIFSIDFWVQTLISTIITMIMIYLIKKVAGNINVPVVQAVVEGV